VPPLCAAMHARSIHMRTRACPSFHSGSVRSKTKEAPPVRFGFLTYLSTSKACYGYRCAGSVCRVA
jgi:hypothetical protein